MEARFILSQDNNVLVIPIGALFKNKDSWAVYTVVKNRARLQNVTLGKKSDTQAIILEGLKEGDSIILFPSDLVADRKRIKSKSEN